MDKQKAATIVLLLSQLAVHYYRPDFTEVMARSIIKDMVHDLVEFAIPDIEKAIETYRRAPVPVGKFKGFPDSGALRKLAADERKHRDDLKKLGPKVDVTDRRPHLWWMQSRQMWKAHWRESDVPSGEMVRDTDTGKLRQPKRAEF